MPAPYRKAGRHGLLIFATILVGLAISLFLAYSLEKFNLGAWMMAVFCGPIFAAFLVGFVWAGRLEKKRIEGLRGLFESRGITMNSDPSLEDRRHFYGPVSYLTDWMGLRNGAENIQWIASSQTVGAFEHLFVTGSGKSTQEHLETVIVVPSPYATHGGMAARRAGFSMKRTWRNSESKFELGDPEFDKLWVLLGSQDIANWFFIKKVREFLADAPHGEAWVAGNNYICLSFDGVLDAENMAVCLDRAQNLAKTIEQYVPFAEQSVAKVD